MNYIEQMLLTDDDITYHVVPMPPLKNGKPTMSWMRLWSQEQRTEKFFEFCRAYNKREDSLLRDNYQQFSHRLHWDECPFVDEVSHIENPRQVLHDCILFSFTNEKWDTYKASQRGMLSEYVKEGHTMSRHDLFQIYYPKGTNVATWLQIAPWIVADALYRKLNVNTPHTMMEFARILDDYFVEFLGFRSALYACKNVARHVAMTHPEWVDPDSFLHGGTGFFDGLLQVFDYKPKDHDILWTHMSYLKSHRLNPIEKHQFLNIEDKLCFFYKHIAMRQGIKKQTKQIPYEWVYPTNWSLKTGLYS
jgi:hypothetical protein